MAEAASLFLQWCTLAGNWTFLVCISYHCHYHMPLSPDCIGAIEILYLPISVA